MNFIFKKILGSLRGLKRIRNICKIIIVYNASLRGLLKKIRILKNVCEIQAFIKCCLAVKNVQNDLYSVRKIQSWYKDVKIRKCRFEDNVVMLFKSKSTNQDYLPEIFIEEILRSEEQFKNSLDFESVIKWIDSFCELGGLLTLQNYCFHLASGEVRL